MKRFTLILTTILSLLAFSSCQDELKDNKVDDSSKIKVAIAIEGTTETKSVVTIPEKGISDITLFFFLNGKLSEAIYTVPESDGSIVISSTKGYAKDASVDVYGLVNVGDKSNIISEGADVSSLKSWTYSISSITSLNSTGFPMAGIVTNAPVGEQFTLTVSRLFAKYGFRINTSSLKYGSFKVTSLKLINAAKTVTPFTANSKVTSTSNVMQGDYATSSDINKLLANTGATFFTLENCQGTLLSGNTDPWSKVPSSIGTKANLCTYIEVQGSYTDNSGGLKATHTYRMYLGQDNVTNFDIIRNTEYQYTLTLADDGFLKATWKAERTVNSDTRALAFAKSKYEVEKGEDCDVVLNSTPAGVACNFKLSDNLINAGVTFNDGYMTLHQTKELDADVTGTLTATSWDGVKTATCTVVAKKYVAGDIVIIIRPNTNTINMTDPEAVSAELGIELQDKEGNTIEDYTASATNWTVSASNANTFDATYSAQTKATAGSAKLAGKNAGTAYIQASCKLNGQTYTSVNSDKNKITVVEDRTIKMSVSDAIYKDQSYPCYISKNYDGPVDLSSTNTNLKFYSDKDCTNSITTTTFNRNELGECYVKWNSNSYASVTMTAQTTNKAVEDNVSIEAYVEKVADRLVVFPSDEQSDIQSTYNGVYGRPETLYFHLQLKDGRLIDVTNAVNVTYTSDDAAIECISKNNHIYRFGKQATMTVSTTDGKYTTKYVVKTDGVPSARMLGPELELWCMPVDGWYGYSTQEWQSYKFMVNGNYLGGSDRLNLNYGGVPDFQGSSQGRASITNSNRLEPMEGWINITTNSATYTLNLEYEPPTVPDFNLMPKYYVTLTLNTVRTYVKLNDETGKWEPRQVVKLYKTEQSTSPIPVPLTVRDNYGNTYTVAANSLTSAEIDMQYTYGNKVQIVECSYLSSEGVVYTPYGYFYITVDNGN